jgi:hypothetical protein
MGAKEDQQWIEMLNASKLEVAKLRVENVRLRCLLKSGELGTSSALLRRALGVLRVIVTSNAAAELAAIEEALISGGPVPEGYAGSKSNGATITRPHWRCSLGAAHGMPGECTGKHSWE